MSVRVVRLRRVIAAPITAVFTRIADHDAYARLPGVRSTRRLRPGEPDRVGVGAERELVLGVSRLVARIVEYDPPRRLAYRIIAIPLPIEHLGTTVSLREIAGGTELQWTSHFRASSRIGAPIIEPAAAIALAAAAGFALRFSARDLEAAYPRWRQALPGNPDAAVPVGRNDPPGARVAPSWRPRPGALLLRILRAGWALPRGLWGRWG